MPGVDDLCSASLTEVQQQATRAGAEAQGCAAVRHRACAASDAIGQMSSAVNSNAVPCPCRCFRMLSTHSMRDTSRCRARRRHFAALSGGAPNGSGPKSGATAEPRRISGRAPRCDRYKAELEAFRCRRYSITIGRRETATMPRATRVKLSFTIGTLPNT